MSYTYNYQVGRHSPFNTISRINTNSVPVNKNATKSKDELASKYKNDQVSPSKLSGKMLALPKRLNKHTLFALYKEKARQAYHTKRVFVIGAGYPTLRRELIMRGWLEKLLPRQYPFLETLSDEVLIQHAKSGNDYERVVLSRYLLKYPSNFVWRMPSEVVPEAKPYRNLVRYGGDTDFTSKSGLIGCAEQEPWYRQEGLCAMSYPRFYKLGESFDERKAFIDDFRLTQCQSILRYVTESIKNGQKIFDFDRGTIPFYILNFALTKVRSHLEEKDHSGLDNGESSELLYKLDIDDWKDFIINSYQILNMKANFKASMRDIVEFSKKASLVLTKLQKMSPTHRWDGFRNLWILKPAHQSRGNGIVIRNSLDEILNFSGKNLQQQYIAQKYVERPFLVYRTKFDIRQYLLVTIDDTKVYLWLYRDCYFKFCSVELNLDDFSEQIHLTNNSVQKKYRNNINRDIRLPASNMWSLQQFKQFLVRENISEKLWDKRVFAGFKENIIAVIMAGMEDIELIPNSFELFGCDFMLDEQLYPILIEINSTPDMTASTDVTARICPKVLKDLIKVVVDVSRRTSSCTGQFELIHEINYTTKRKLTDVNFLINGTGMTLLPNTRSTGSKGSHCLQFIMTTYLGLSKRVLIVPNYLSHESELPNAVKSVFVGLHKNL